MAGQLKTKPIKKKNFRETVLEYMGVKSKMGTQRIKSTEDAIKGIREAGGKLPTQAKVPKKKKSKKKSKKKTSSKKTK